SGPSMANIVNNNPNTYLSTVFTGKQWSSSQIAYTLPTNLVGTGVGQIPMGAQITNVQLVVKHREGAMTEAAPGNCGWPVITNAQYIVTNGGAIKYTVSASDIAKLQVGQLVSVVGATPNAFNQYNSYIAAIDNVNDTFTLTGTGNPGTWTS